MRFLLTFWFLVSLLQKASSDACPWVPLEPLYHSKLFCKQQKPPVAKLSREGLIERE